MRIKASASFNRSNLGLNKKYFLTNKTPTIASRVLPEAIPAATGIGAPVIKLTKNAPIATPGQSSVPKSSNAANEMPVGGQQVLQMYLLHLN